MNPFYFYRPLILVFFITALFLKICSAQPVISSFNPASGNPGTTVTINGTGFSSNSTSNIVFFGPIRATVLSATASTITVAVPAGVGCAPISVTNHFLTAYAAQDFIPGFPGGGSFTPLSFAPPVNFIPGNGAVNGLTADFDGDGRADLVTDNQKYPSSDSLHFFRNTGSPGNISFVPVVTIALGSSGTSVVIADLNGDGKPDVAVSNPALNTVTVFINTSSAGSISFDNGTQYITGNQPGHLAAADLDGDGKPDLVVCNYGSNTISVLKNTGSNGTLSFAPKSDFSAPSAPADIAIKDFDGDGKPDIALAGTSDSVVLFRNASSAGVISFLPATSLTVTGRPVTILAEDFDGDGKPELAVASDSVFAVFVFHNISTPGTIAFGRQAVSTAAPFVTGIAISDLNGDGKPDIAVNYNATDSVSLLVNTSAAGIISFGVPVSYAAGYNVISITTADFDGDGKADIFTADYAGNYVSVFRNLINGINPPYIKSFSPVLAPKDSSVTIYGKNFTGTGYVSFGGITALSFTVLSDTIMTAVVGAGASGSIEVSTTGGDTSLAGFTFIPPPVITAISPDSATTGTPVLFYGAHFSGASSVSFGGTPAQSFTVISDSLASAIVGKGAGGYVSIRTPGGNDTLAGFVFIPIPVITGFLPASGPVGATVTITGRNFSLLGSNNIVYFGAVRATNITSTDSSVTVKVPLGATYVPLSLTNRDFNRIAFAAKPFITTFPGGRINANSFRVKADAAVSDTFPLNASISDFDGDGLPDLAAANSVSSTVSLIRNTSVAGKLSFGARVNYKMGPINTGTVNVCAADFDGDGKPDIAVINQMDTNVTIMKNGSTAGSISFGSKTILSTGYETSPGYLTVADFDGDGKPDLAVACGFEIKVYKNTSVNGVISFGDPVLLQAYGQSNLTGITVNDFDGDGKPDVATTDYLNGLVLVYLNTSAIGTVSFATHINFTGSFSPNSIASGDMDGDGLADIVFTNGGTQTLAFLRNLSKPGALSFAPETDFNLGNIPYNVAIGDLDGDGKPDVSVATRNNNTASVFRNRSTTGTISFDTLNAYTTAYGYDDRAVSIGDLNGDGKPDLAVVTPNTNSITVLLNYADSTPAPIIRSFTPDSAAGGGVISISGTHFTGTTAVSFGGIPASSFTIVSDTLITATTGTGATGSVAVTSPNGTDSLGGFHYIISTLPPVIQFFSPDSGTTGTILVISGHHFSGTSSVTIGGIPASSFSVESDSVVDATVAAGASGIVRLTTPFGTDSISGFIFIPPLPVPKISSFSPLTGTKGTIVNINGSGFALVTYVAFGGTAAASFTVVSDSLITAVVANGASGAVLVASNRIDSLPGFLYKPGNAPVILSFIPDSAKSGETILIKGVNFTSANSINLGATPALSFTVISDSLLSAVVGAGSSGNIVVTTPYGADSAGTFTFISTTIIHLPVINFFTPDSAGAGAQVSLSGHYFTGTSAVSFGGIPASSFTVVSDSLITAVTGPGQSGNIIVKTAAGSGSIAGFIFTSADTLKPVIGSFSPQSGNEGTAVIITGSGFSGTVSVYFGNVPASSFTVVSDSVIAAVVGVGATGNVVVTTPSGTATLSGYLFTSGLTLYPNPANTYVTVNFPIKTSVSTVELIDMTGRKVDVIAVSPGQGSEKINISGVQPGIYIVLWKNGTDKIRKTLLIE